MTDDKTSFKQIKAVSNNIGWIALLVALVLGIAWFVPITPPPADIPANEKTVVHHETVFHPEPANGTVVIVHAANTYIEEPFQVEFERFNGTNFTHHYTVSTNYSEPFLVLFENETRYRVTVHQRNGESRMLGTFNPNEYPDRLELQVAY